MLGIAKSTGEAILDEAVVAAGVPGTVGSPVAAGQLRRIGRLRLDELAPNGPDTPARVLWLHDTDRWYLGDFLRHAAWLDWLYRRLPGAHIDFASHPAYLALYQDGRFGQALDVSDLKMSDLRAYDLVIVPSSFPDPTPADPGVRRLLRTWDRGWSLYAYGQRVAGGTKRFLNYFRSAHPDTLPFVESSPQSDCGGSVLSFSGAERVDAEKILEQLAPGAGPVLIYNPTSSTRFTRETDVEKEVDNTLTPAQHAVVLTEIAGRLNGHDILVGAPLKPGDEENAAALRQVAGAVPGARCLLDAVVPGVDSRRLRDFAAVLASPRVCASVGAGTGSNTHLSALVGTWSLSFERAADAVMQRNWSEPGAFQMGSFRWRNPSHLSAIHLLRWDRLDEAALVGAAVAFLTHHQTAHAFDASVGRLRKDLLLGTVLSGASLNHYSDFSDELTFLRNRFGACAPTVGSDVTTLAQWAAEGGSPEVLLQLFGDSNLHKLIRMVRRDTPHE